MEFFKNLSFLLPVMGYYIIESLISALFVTVVWRILLENLTNIHIGYLQWVGIIWIIKVVFFDVFKLVSNLNNTNYANQYEQENEKL